MRIQILPLPAVMVGDDLEEPFALVFDQAEEGVNKELLYEFAKQCGSRTHLIVSQTVEIVDRDAELQPAPVVNISDMTIKDPDAAKIGAAFRAAFERLRDKDQWRW
ncbi:hypothetical protein [Nonomuraea rubra]|uniref:Uncharacterized protein n=1 Tax=Nonomuraea rubra TaxID=46180 RepID=A0A7X0P6I4_9ACTN|nr:hypothetical protein [Nonomuraea rubra]MBB6556180.1 hypothetical protein [Nonomuraea rubra]